MRRGLYVLLGVLLVPTVGLVGDVVTDGKFKSTMSMGAPLEVASDDMVLNLNADMVDGLEASDFASASDTYTKAEVNAVVAASVASATRKEYYMTWAGDGTAALGACAAGFHMASLWEIANPSSLRYAFDHPDAGHTPDSGHGPPGYVWAWIRTGGQSESTTDPGLANCNLWTSNSASHRGTSVSLPTDWTNSMGWNQVSGTPWISRTSLCSHTLYVWCIED